MKVAIYTRESGSRQYKPASPRAAYSPNTTFCLRSSAPQSEPMWKDSATLRVDGRAAKSHCGRSPTCPMTTRVLCFLLGTRDGFHFDRYSHVFH